MIATFSGFVRFLTNLCGWICEGALVVLAIMVAGEVLSRNIFGVSYSGVEILASYTLVILTFVGGGVAIAGGAVYRMTLVDDWIGGRVSALVSVIVHLASISLLLLVLYYSAKLTESSYARGVVFQANSSISLWILQAAVPIGTLAMIFVLLASAAGRIRELVTGNIEPHPAADPVEMGE